MYVWYGFPTEPARMGPIEPLRENLLHQTQRFPAKNQLRRALLLRPVCYLAVCATSFSSSRQMCSNTSVSGSSFSTKLTVKDFVNVFGSVSVTATSICP